MQIHTAVHQESSLFQQLIVLKYGYAQQWLKKDSTVYQFESHKINPDNLDLLAIANNSKQFMPLHKRQTVDMGTMTAFCLVKNMSCIIYSKLVCEYLRLWQLLAICSLSTITLGLHTFFTTLWLHYQCRLPSIFNPLIPGGNKNVAH